MADQNHAVEQSFARAKQQYATARWTSRRLCGGSRRSRSRCTVGRRRRRRFEKLGSELAAAWPSPAITRQGLHAEQLRADLDAAIALIPGTHRLNLHASYAETGGKHVERNEVDASYFGNWIDWARSKRVGIDFNSTFFAHPKAPTASRWPIPTRASAASGRARHRCRKIGERSAGRWTTPALTTCGSPTIQGRDHRSQGAPPRLRKSLDEMFAVPSIRPITWIPSKPSSSASAPRPTWSLARVLLGLRGRKSKAADIGRGHSTPPRPLPTRSPRCWSSCRNSCSTSAAASAGTATTW